MQTMYTYEMIILFLIKFNTSYQIKIIFHHAQHIFDKDIIETIVKMETSKTAV